MHQTSPFTNSRCLRQATGALTRGTTVRLLVGAMLAAGVLLSAGCGPKNYLNENDKLRRQNMALKREIDELKDKLERRSGQLKVLKRRYEAPSATQPGLSEPTLSKIELGQYSGPIDTDGDGTDDTLRLYLRTLDQKGRMMPVVAKARLRVVHIPDKGEPKELTSQTFDEQSFSDAYRSSFTGQHYTLETKLPDPLPEGVTEVTVKVTVTHLTSEARFSRQKSYRVTRQ